VLVRVVYGDGEPETYLLPLGFASGEWARLIQSDLDAFVLVNVAGKSKDAGGVIFDASRERECWTMLLETIVRQRRIKSATGELVGWHNGTYDRIRGDGSTPLEPILMKAEQSNSAAHFDGQFMLKMFRKIDTGVNPDLEISRHLTEKMQFPHSPALVGAIEYRIPNAEPLTFGIMHEFLNNSTQAWEHVLGEIGKYFEQVGIEFTGANLDAELTPETRWIDLVDREPTPLALEALGPFLNSAALLGTRTAEMHLALAAAKDIPAFAPEPFTPFYQRGLFQSMRNHGRRVLQMLRKQLPNLPDASQSDARAIVDLEADIIARFRQITERKITALRIRCHGDYHLGQVLYTGKDFKLIDFEGEPMRAISERRIKRSPLRDVAGMLRSFHYASHAGLLTEIPGVVVRTQDSAALAPWARFLYVWTSAAFVKAYLTQVGDAPFVPASRDELRCLLDTYLLEKSLYELDYEMNNRPTWISIPIRGVLDLMDVPQETKSPVGDSGRPIVN
jgi:maltose alpha-D-glucosyltransferase / alpha-amylase